MIEIEKQKFVGMVSIPVDINLNSLGVPSYSAKDDAHDTIEPDAKHKVPSLKELVTHELLLLRQQKRLSVRDIAKKFEKGVTTTKPSNEPKWKEMITLDREVLLKRLRDLFEALKDRVAGWNKDDAGQAISLLEALAVQLTQLEEDIFQEKSEIKRVENFLEQSMRNARKAVDDEKAVACSIIEMTRQTVQRVEHALRENELRFRNEKRNLETQNLDESMKEVQEARRIIMLHQPSQVMDMDHECQALRMQLREKCTQLIQLRKQLEVNKTTEQNNDLFELAGSESLGSCLQVVPCSPDAPDFLICSIQWFRVMDSGSRKVLISGAIKPVYAPEPFDIGQILIAEVAFEDERVDVTTTCPIDPAPGLANYVEALARNFETEFPVIVLQVNGKPSSSSSIHMFGVGTTGIKLRDNDIIKAKEAYSTSMQLCGVRGGGNAAVQSLFWQATRDMSFVLAFELDRERNASIMLARKFASDCGINLMGPGDMD